MSATAEGVHARTLPAEEVPEWLTARELAREAGVCVWTLRQHIRQNVAGLKDKRHRVPGMRGDLWQASAVRRYLGMMAALRRGRKKEEGMAG